jgi:hypothetical protein
MFVTDHDFKDKKLNKSWGKMFDEISEFHGEQRWETANSH